ncbi:MAG: hybrid sensor histidine kinase/response regulator [Bacteroidetes bacterium]|nr:MAG: hybrid sensor histidine kinase/response regulator [Bacteroidota bacterium]
MSKDRIRVLYLDDEDNNLQAFKAGFRRNFEIYTVNNAADAFRILDEIEIHIALADQRMPKMSGVEFFERVHDKHPDVIRILITAYTNSQTIIDAVNKGRIDQYVVKPWDPNFLRNVIETFHATYLARKELKLKNEELQKTNDELNRFVYSASHDLRAPLMSILGLVELSRLDKENSDPFEYLQMIESSVLKLDSFIQNIIEYYQNARAEGLKENINFKELVDDAIAVLKNTDQTVEFEVNINDELPFQNDEFRIRVILNNLISNAIKYQKEDGTVPKVNITIRTEPKYAFLSIQDNGVGILQEHMESIFKMFFRTKSSKKSPGTGIGLYIVKEALNKIGGEIKVKSVYGEGTTFELILPNLHE